MNVEVCEFLPKIQSEVDQRAGRVPLSPKRYFQILTLRTLIPNPYSLDFSKILKKKKASLLYNKGGNKLLEVGGVCYECEFEDEKS